MDFDQAQQIPSAVGPVGILSVEQYTSLIESYTSVLNPHDGILVSTCPSIKVLSLRIEDTKVPNPRLYFCIDSDVEGVRQTTLALHLETLQNLWRALKTVFHKTMVAVPILPPEISSKSYLNSRFMRGIVLYLAALLRRLLSHSIIKRHEVMVQLFTRHESDVLPMLQKLANPDFTQGHAPGDDIIRNIVSRAHGHLHSNLHESGLMLALNLSLLYNFSLDDAAFLKTAYYGPNFAKLITDRTITKSALATFRGKTRINAAYLQSIDQVLDMPRGQFLNTFLYGLIDLEDFLSPNFGKKIRGIFLKRHLIIEKNLKSAYDSVKRLSASVAEIITAETSISSSMSGLADSLTFLFVSETKFDGVLAGPATNSVAACVNPPTQSDFLHTQIANQLRADVYPRLAASLDIISAMAKMATMRYDYIIVGEFLASILKKKASDIIYLKVQQETIGDVVLINKDAVKRQIDAIRASDLHTFSYGIYKDTERESPLSLSLAYESDKSELEGILNAIDDEATVSFNSLCSRLSLSRAQIDLLDSFRRVHAAFIEHIMYSIVMESRFVYEYLFYKCMVSELIVHSMGRLSAIFGRTIHLESNLWEYSDEWIRKTRGQETPWHKINELDNERYELEVDLHKEQGQ
ncbi:Hypothetical protein DHA2_152301 [Giardia duodenalis]|uniref:Uncharacterized protein n=1 Tax=Giardia intestinalis TaxID=5741 RepID=V6TJU7_GIAIN|nr:Hypothetical protein DHA2_152301 [Giardia intestinalis]